MHLPPQLERSTAAASRSRLIAGVACACTFAAATIALAASSDAAGAPPALWLRLVGRLHPLVVHFPIALLLTAVMVEVFRLVRRKPRPSPTALTCMGFGVAFAAAAIASGLANEQFESHGRALAPAIDRHQVLGIAAGSIGGAALLLGLINLKSARRGWRAAYVLSLVLTAAAIGVTGHLGGSLVYGDDYLTSLLRPQAREPETSDRASETQRTTDPTSTAPDSASDPAEAGVFFNPDVVAIITERCADCHGPTKQRGGLRLDHYDGLFGEDESLWVVQPFDPERSELLRRVRLPEGDDDAMPPKGERLSSQQIALIETWIAQGAPEAAPAAPSIEPRADEQVRADETPGDSTDGFTVPAPTDVPWNQIIAGDPARLTAALDAITSRGGAATRIQQGSDAVDVNLSVVGESISDADLDLLSDLRETLVWLNLGGTSITDVGLARLAAFSQLRRLHLERTAVTDAGLVSIAAIPRLEYLNLYGTTVTDAGLESLVACTTLRELYLWQTSATAEGVAAFAAARPDVAVWAPFSSTSDAGGAAPVDRP